MGVRLAELMGALSFSTDLVMGQPMEDAQRSAIIAVELGRRIDAPRDEQRDAYYLSLFRSVGCNANRHELGQLWGDEHAVSAWMAKLDHGKPAQVMGAIFKRVGENLPALRRVGLVLKTMASMPGLMEGLDAHCETGRMLAE